jgi:hypothetical protein
MRKVLLAIAASAALLAVQSQPAQAQFWIGPHVSFGTDSDLGIGGRLGFGVPAADEGIFSRLQIMVAFDYFLDGLGCDNCTYWELTPAAIVPIAISEGLDTYVGAGLNIARFSFDEDILGVDVSSTDTGLAAIGGLRFPISSLAAFGEARLNIGGADQLVLTFGFLFGGGGD